MLSRLEKIYVYERILAIDDSRLHLQFLSISCYVECIGRERSFIRPSVDIEFTAVRRAASKVLTEIDR